MLPKLLTLEFKYLGLLFTFIQHSVDTAGVPSWYVERTERKGGFKNSRMGAWLGWMVTKHLRRPLVTHGLSCLGTAIPEQPLPRTATLQTLWCIRADCSCFRTRCSSRATRWSLWHRLFKFVTSYGCWMCCTVCYPTTICRYYKARSISPWKNTREYEI